MDTDTATATATEMEMDFSASIPVSVYRQRRQRLAQCIGADGIAVISTAPEYSRNRDSTFAYRHDSYFYYLTGFAEPGAVLVIEGCGTATLFCQPRDRAREQWDGLRLGAEAAPEVLGVEHACPNTALDERMPQLLSSRHTVYWTQHLYPAFDRRMHGWLQTVAGRQRQGFMPPAAVADACVFLDEMRLIKDRYELDIMRRAARISAQAHRRAMQASAHRLRTGQSLREYHLDAELLYHFRHCGSEYPAYTSIVAGGGNACILHYRAGNTPIGQNELVLIDAGCELHGYASDITRTFPAGGVFTPVQRDVYDIVLEAQQAAIAATTAAHRFDDPHHAAVQILTQGLFDLRVLSHDTHGSVADAVQDKAYAPWYMHRTGHWLGMDVHDCGPYHDPAQLGSLQSQRDALHQRQQAEKDGDSPAVAALPSRPLQAGMVLTLEPGLYFLPETGAPQHLHHIGIRIEDDAIVQADGQPCELITRDVPVAAAEIEALMKELL